MTKPRAVLLTVVVVLAAVIVGGWLIIRRGFSARDKPTAIEAFAARTARQLAVPAAMKNAKNPFSPTPELMAEARAHFADHCATCHANNGSGQTVMGQNMYPKPPDLRRSETQNLTDGEIYSIIHNGIRLTGMPAWGESVNDSDSWKLVLFIRHLPQLTPAEEQEMEALNPMSPAEMREEQQEEEFLKGAGPAPAKSTAPHHSPKEK